MEIHESCPDQFNAQIEVAGCYVEADGKLLLLQNAAGDTEPGKWGVPAGKVGAGEGLLEGARRELCEETGISVKPSELESLGALYIRKPGFSYVFHLFKVKVDAGQVVKLSDEHTAYRWVTGSEIAAMPLMAGAKEAYEKYRTSGVKKRGVSVVSSYLVLRKEGKILFNLRKNTGYCDGMWGLVAGHVEEGETATEGMIREAREEIGIEVEASQLKVIHVMHRKSNRQNIDVFFECLAWKREIVNQELHKCERVAFFSEDHLPEKIMDYNLAMLKAVRRGEFYSEMGWDF